MRLEIGDIVKYKFSAGSGFSTWGQILNHKLILNENVYTINPLDEIWSDDRIIEVVIIVDM